MMGASRPGSGASLRAVGATCATLASIAAFLFALTNFPLREGHYEPDRPFLLPLMAVVSVLSIVAVAALDAELKSFDSRLARVGLGLWLLGQLDVAAYVALAVVDGLVPGSATPSSPLLEGIRYLGFFAILSAELANGIALIVLSLVAWRSGLASGAFGALGVVVACAGTALYFGRANVAVAFLVWATSLFVLQPLWYAWLGRLLRRAPRPGSGGVGEGIE